MIRRALISVSDKQGLLPFVKGLKRQGIEIVSTGGTARLLKENGIPAVEIGEFTGFPEILGGRVKTLHPKVHGAILADRSDQRHLKEARKLGLKWIDLVVVNLYPFEAAAQKKGISLEALLEEIDIGGAALLRSAAKNFRSVAVVCKPSQYSSILEELRRNQGALSEKTRLRLAVEAFLETSYYDHVIHQALAHRAPSSRKKGERIWPERLVLGAVRRQVLRYGENPHQRGAWYVWPNATGQTSNGGRAQQLHGKELSFNNLLDLDAAVELVSSFSKPCAAIVKHNNPCGVACDTHPAQAFRRAFEADPRSAFGGIAGFNRPVDAQAARAVLSSGFLECLAAPGYSAEALKLLKSRRNLRILKMPAPRRQSRARCVDVKQVAGGLLLQDPDSFRRSPSRWRLVTKTRPTSAQMRDLAFAWTVARFARSNAVVIVKGEQTVGVGAGQTSRVDSVRIALRKAGSRAQGAVLASDGFFPKPDGPQAAVRAGIRAIVQPGGSVQDPQVTRVAERGRVSMLMTGERHFRH